MGRPKPWLSRVPLIIGILESSAEEFFNRGDVESMFGIARSAAQSLMFVAGMSRTVGPNNQEILVVSRTNLLHYLRNSPETHNAMVEAARRARLASKLKAAQEDLKLRTVRLRVTQADEWTRFEELPNVSIQPGLMQVAFTPGDPVDLLETLFRWIKAVGNDYDAFAKMCAPAAPADPPATEAPAVEARSGG